jgi:PPOX class probable F420-dependent enzyme
MALSENAVDLARGANTAIIATKNPSGSMQVHPMWVSTDGEHILLNTEVHRRKFKNIEADPSVTVTIIDKDNPWRWSEIRGRVVEKITGPEGRGHIDDLAKKYMDVDVYPNPIRSERVKLVIEPDYVFDFPPSS